MVIWKLAPGRGCPAPDIGLGATGAALSDIRTLWPILRKNSPMTVKMCMRARPHASVGVVERPRKPRPTPKSSLVSRHAVYPS